MGSGGSARVPSASRAAGREVERKLGDRVEALVVLERLDVVEDEDDGLASFPTSQPRRVTPR